MKYAIFGAMALALLAAIAASLVRLEEHGYNRGKLEEQAAQRRVIAEHNEKINALNAALAKAANEVKVSEPVIVETVRETVKEIVLPPEPVPSTALSGRTLQTIDKIGKSK